MEGTGVTIAEQLIEQAKRQRMRIVFPEGAEPRIAQAARRAKDAGVCDPILIGEETFLREAAAKAGILLDGITTVDPAAWNRTGAYAEEYAQRRQASPRVAERILAKPLVFGAAMVHGGDADGMVGGVASTTAQVVMAAAMGIGYAGGVETPSSLFIMELPERSEAESPLLVFADCAVNVAPTPEQLADIAVTTAETARTLLRMEPPRGHAELLHTWQRRACRCGSCARRPGAGQGARARAGH